MINFLNEIAQIAELPIGEINNTVAISCIGGKAVVVNNYLKILTYSSNHIVLKIKEDELIIEGRDIIIKQLSKKDICLVGNIAGVYFAREVRENEKQA